MTIIKDTSPVDHPAFTRDEMEFKDDAQRGSWKLLTRLLRYHPEHDNPVIDLPMFLERKTK